MQVKTSDNRIIEVTDDMIRIESRQWKKGGIKKGAFVTNGKIKTKVKSIVDGTHDVLRRLIDDKHLVEKDPNYYVGATVWGERSRMPRAAPEKVISYDPEEHSFKINFHTGFNGPQKFSRYYFENLPAFLDEPGEYYYNPSSGRLFLRLPEDRDPNSSTIEAAKEYFLFYVKNQSNIIISGLDLRFSNIIPCGTQKSRQATFNSSAVHIEGNCSNIKVKNCRIYDVAYGIVVFPEKNGDIIDHIEVCDNDLRNIDGSAINIIEGSGNFHLSKFMVRLIHVKILRNRAINIGGRVLSYYAGGQPTFFVRGGEMIEVAGKVLYQVFV